MKNEEKKAKKAPKLYKDKDGFEIPSTHLHKTDRDKDAAARRFLKKAIDLSKRLEAFKKEIFETGDEIYDRLLKENRVVNRENAKGGYSMMTIDKTVKVEFTVSETITFDEKIDIAKIKLDEYLDEVTEGVNKEVKAFVNRAFNTSKGRLDTKSVLGLFQYKIEHPKWVEAMELIKQSIDRNNSKRYVRISEKDENGQYKQVLLDFAAL